MDTKQVNEALEKLFLKEDERIVFWNDPEQEFLGFMNEQMFFPVEGVHVIRLDNTGALEAKLAIENSESDGRFLVYSPEEEPDYEDDWLLDIRLYSRSFRADRASILHDQLGLESQHLRDHLAQRRKFFDNRERLQKLQAVTSPKDTAEDLDRKMLSVVVRADQPELFNIVLTLLHRYQEAEAIDLQEPPPEWQQIKKFELDEPFWRMGKKAFGYTEETPSLENLLIRLLVTDVAQHLQGSLPPALAHLVLPQAGAANAVVCLAQWRDSASKSASYDKLSEYVANRINLDEQLHSFEIEDLLGVQTFLAVEKEIARSLKDRVVATSETINVDEVRNIASRRQAGHWALPTVPGAAEIPRKALHAVYEALAIAAEFFDLRNKHCNCFDFENATEFYRAYEVELFRFDQLYRHFCEQADKSQQWNVVKQLREEVEKVYSNWYLTTLGLAWGKCVESGLLERWKMDEVPNEYDFYRKHVRSWSEAADNRRAYVIISDAFRYEAAKELTQQLNGKFRFQANLSSQLSVLPSYTALGMASLLPHKTLEYDQKGNVLVDGKLCSSTDQRNEVLSTVDGIVLRADDLLAMKKEEGREAVSGKKVVYIYHDEIDSRGEKASTEADTFDAVRKAIEDLTELVRFIVNGLNGNYVVVTADHGFLFSETPPTETEKSKLDEKPAGTVVAKKRYLLGRNLPDADEAYHGSCKITAKADGDMEFWLPKAANRFHFTGGARFIHGGAMPQEVCVPVVTVRHVRGKGKEETAVKRVGVQVLDVNHRITTPKYRFQLLQTQPVSDRVKEITLKVAIYDGNEPVTNIEKVTFDSTSEKMEDRTKDVVLVLEDREYNKKNKYRLVLRDADTDIEQSSVDVIIDRAFTDDF